MLKKPQLTQANRVVPIARVCLCTPFVRTCCACHCGHACGFQNKRCHSPLSSFINIVSDSPNRWIEPLSLRLRSVYYPPTMFTQDLTSHVCFFQSQIG